jgi:hypothetical protein
VIYLCGDCEATYGVPPEMLAVPDPPDYRSAS